MNEHADIVLPAAQAAAPPPVDLESLRQYRGMSYPQLAVALEVNHATQARKYALGHAWPRPDILLRILKWGGGRLSIFAMLEKYLAEQEGRRRRVA